MLGHNPLLRRKLEKNGLRAVATVVTATRTRWAETQGSPAVVADTSILYKLVLRVEPDGQLPFEADALTRLAALRDRGVLSEAEFQAQKSKLLRV